MGQFQLEEILLFLFDVVVVLFTSTFTRNTSKPAVMILI